MGWFDFLKKAKVRAQALLSETPKVHRREDVVREHAKRPPTTALRPSQRPTVHEQRQRDIIHESLEIAARTKRRNTAESRLGVAEQLLDELAEQGLETMEDRINRQTLCALRRDLEQRFKG